MQLFILDRNPAFSPQMLCDIHVRKMCLETAQILSGVIFWQQKIPYATMPKPYSVFHPVIKALNTPFKVNWVLTYNTFLHSEYIFRFNKEHCYSKLAAMYRETLFQPSASEDWSFARAFKNFQTLEPDIVAAYREYYRFKKSQISRWHYTKRKEPDWLG